MYHLQLICSLIYVDFFFYFIRLTFFQLINFRQLQPDPSKGVLISAYYISLYRKRKWTFNAIIKILYIQRKTILQENGNRIKSLLQFANFPVKTGACPCPIYATLLTFQLCRRHQKLTRLTFKLAINISYRGNGSTCYRKIRTSTPNKYK